MLHLAFVLLLTLQEPGDLQVHFKTQKCMPDQHVCEYTGNVVVTYQEVKVESNSFTVNTETYDVTTPDHVTFTRPGEELEGENLELNIKTKPGTLHDVNGHVGPGYYFKAAYVERFEDGHYLLTEAT